MPIPRGFAHLSLPAIAAPMFLTSGPDLVVETCRAGLVGTFPALNQRTTEGFVDWLNDIEGRLGPNDAPYGVNLIVHKSNNRLDEDLELCVKHKVPLVITSLGAREEVNQAIHSYGGIVMHDIINIVFAHKALEKGADGLIAVCAGAGGHAGTHSPFALIQEIRGFFDGPLALSGSISTGRAIYAAQAIGADLAYIGTAFIACDEARASDGYKDMIVNSAAKDIVYSSLFTGVSGNYLAPSIAAAGLDPNNLPEGDKATMNFREGESSKAKAWKDVWGAGQGIGAITKRLSAADYIAQLRAEYTATHRSMNVASSEYISD